MHITTFSKVHIDPLNPNPWDLHIEDIAHALSLLCRANGHFPWFYSVAQHCLNCAAEAKSLGCTENVQLACLLHDAAEAYISDIPRPVKEKLPDYNDIEKRLLSAIWGKWLSKPLTKEEMTAVFEIDDAMLKREFSKLMGESVAESAHELTSAPDLGERGFSQVERTYIRTFHQLRHEKGNISTAKVVGVDWANGRWIAVELFAGGAQPVFYDSISELCKHNTDASMILIDVPIGLPESAAEAKLRPDSEARKLLRKRSSSVFNVLFRQIVYTDTAKEAWVLNEKLDAKMSQLSLGIQGATRQVDEFLQENIAWKARLVESHPELGFMVLNAGIPMSASKKTLEGSAQRSELLRQQGLPLDELMQAFNCKGGKRSQINDLLDAACLAVNARNGIAHGFRSIPEKPSSDSTGLPMQMIVAGRESV